MYNLPKCDSEKAAKNLNKTTKANVVTRVHIAKRAAQLQPSSESRWIVYALANKKRCYGCHTPLASCMNAIGRGFISTYRNNTLSVCPGLPSR